MSPGKYILVNGEFVATEEYRLSPAEFEQILFSEQIRAVRTAFPFFAETLDLIKLKLTIFNQSYPDFIRNDGAELLRQLQRALTRNKFFMGAVFTLSFSPSGSGIKYTIASRKLPAADYQLNEKGLYAAIFDKARKPLSPLSNLSIGSEVLWKISDIHLSPAEADCFFLMNTRDQIVESPGSNIYLIRGNRVKGAAREQGACHDVSRPFVLQLFRKLKLEYSEADGISRDDLRQADEIFLADAINGIRWIIGFEDKRYFNNTIRQISEGFGRRLVQ
jgi:branched-chain amino acid aminotransferase